MSLDSTVLRQLVTADCSASACVNCVTYKLILAMADFRLKFFKLPNPIPTTSRHSAIVQSQTFQKLIGSSHLHHRQLSMEISLSYFRW